ncbi:MAG TPA: hypothetical protein VL241_09390, partial [Gemmatimonadales bacterium]|nr:hypothetical protein [Gemmatimonadales bacterium]
MTSNRLPVTGHRLLVTGYLLAAAPLAGQSPLAGRWDHVRLPHDALRYDISLTLPDSGSAIAADVITQWRLGGPGPLRLELDAAMKVRAVTVNGAAVHWTRHGDRIEIPLPGAAGTQVTTRVRY